METGKPSTSSFTSDLFGTKPSSATPPSSHILGSIFPPPPPTIEPLHLSENEKSKKNGSAKKLVSGEAEQRWNTKDEKTVEPFHYSSSIYYGGQDVCEQPQNPVATTFNKDVGEDDSGSASRGNWWQGSLYY